MTQTIDPAATPTTAVPADVPILGKSDYAELAKRRYDSRIIGGKKVIVSNLPRSTVMAIDGSCFDNNGKVIEEQMRMRPAKLLARAIVDAAGTPCFEAGQAAEVDFLPRDIFNAAWEAFVELQGFDKDSDDEGETSPQG